VKYINKITTESKLNDLFSQYGRIQDIKYLEGNRNKFVTAVINFQDSVQAKNAIQGMNNYVLNGYKIAVLDCVTERKEKSGNSNGNSQQKKEIKKIKQRNDI